MLFAPNNNNNTKHTHTKSQKRVSKGNEILKYILLTNFAFLLTMRTNRFFATACHTAVPMAALLYMGHTIHNTQRHNNNNRRTQIQSRENKREKCVSTYTIIIQILSPIYTLHTHTHTCSLSLFSHLSHRNTHTHTHTTEVSFNTHF